MMTSDEVRQWFRAHPEEEAAAFERMRQWERAEQNGWLHSFQRRAQPETHCLYCGNSYRIIQWQTAKGYPYCREGWAGDEQHGTRPDVATTIRQEEERFIARLLKWQDRIHEVVPDPSALTGEDLARLHHTHGLDPDTVMALLDYTYPESVHDDYLTAFHRHRQTGKQGEFKGSDNE